jgi:hypothetical protein
MNSIVKTMSASVYHFNFLKFVTMIRMFIAFFLRFFLYASVGIGGVGVGFYLHCEQET